MQEIKLDMVDFWDGYMKNDNFFYHFLKQHFQITLNNDADYIIFSCFGKKFRKSSSQAIRIFFTGENVRPNFNVTDYAISFDYVDEKYNDRHFRLPLYRCYDEWSHLLANNCITKAEADDLIGQKDKFCNFIFTNSAPVKRNTFFEKLSKYQKVHSAGRYKNNIGRYLEPQERNNFQRTCKFTIAFENASYPGYTTEKILFALAAKTIPIYWGNPLVHLDFNPKAFINAHDYKSFDEVIDLVLAIDADENLYRSYLMQPAVLPHQIEKISDEHLLKFFQNIFSSNTIRRKHKKFFLPNEIGSSNYFANFKKWVGLDQLL